MMTHTVTGDDGKLMTVKNMAARKPHFQVFSMLDDLRSKGITDVPADQPLTLYQCLLGGKVVEQRMTSVAYRNMLKDAGDQDTDDQDLPLPDAEPQCFLADPCVTDDDTDDEVITAVGEPARQVATAPTAGVAAPGGAGAAGPPASAAGAVGAAVVGAAPDTAGDADSSSSPSSSD